MGDRATIEMDAYTYVTKRSSNLRSLNNLNIRKVMTRPLQKFYHMQRLCGARSGSPLVFGFPDPIELKRLMIKHTFYRSRLIR